MKCTIFVLTILLLMALSRSVASSQTAAFDLQGAIDAAQPGDVVEVPYAVYYGSIVVDKPLHLRGVVSPKGQRPVIDGEGTGTVVTITAPDAIVENFVIRNSGNVIDKEEGGIAVNKVENVQIVNNYLENVLYGVRGIEAHGLQVLDNYITGKELDIARRGDGLRLWQSEDCLVAGNTVERVRDAIFWFSDGTTVRDNIFHDNRYGIHMMYTDGMTIEHNHLKGNSVGAYLMYSRSVMIQGNTFQDNRGPSGYGLALKDMDAVTVRDNYMLDNRVGLFFDNSPSQVDIVQEISRNALAFNDVGVLMMPAVRHNDLRQNTFLDNLEQVGVKGGGSNPGDELGRNSWDGNYWSDYVGYDVSDDGVGDLPYHSESLFENLADRYPNLALLQFSPAQQAVDLAARAFPVIKPKPKLTDRTPQMSPPLPAVALMVEEKTTHMGWLAMGLILVAIGLFASQIRTIFRKQPVSAERHRRSFVRDRMIPTTQNTSQYSSDHPSSVQRTPIATTSLRKDNESQPMISIRNLTKRYPRPGRAWWSDATIVAVDDLSFELAAGQSLALWGVNGAGKTTVLKCLLGLLSCEGDLSLNGYDLRREGRAARRHLGYVPQELAFHNDLSVVETCRFYARLKDVSSERIPVVLAQVGLTGQERKAVGALSGGMKQRLALALALLADPPVLLLDEPTSNLDAGTRGEFIDLLVGLRQAGKTLLFTSHHVEEVTQLAERVLILQDGRLVAEGPTAEMAPLLIAKRTTTAELAGERGMADGPHDSDGARPRAGAGAGLSPLLRSPALAVDSIHEEPLR